MEEDWRMIGGRLEEDLKDAWRRIGGRLKNDPNGQKSNGYDAGFKIVHQIVKYSIKIMTRAVSSRRC